MFDVVRYGNLVMFIHFSLSLITVTVSYGIFIASKCNNNNKVFFQLGHRRDSMSDDDHMSDRDMGAPSPGGMSSLGGGSRPGSRLSNRHGGSSVRDHLDELPSQNDDDEETPLSKLPRSMRSSSKAASAAMSASAMADMDDEEQVKLSRG